MEIKNNLAIQGQLTIQTVPVAGAGMSALLEESGVVKKKTFCFFS